MDPPRYVWQKECIYQYLPPYSVKSKCVYEDLKIEQEAECLRFVSISQSYGERDSQGCQCHGKDKNQEKQNGQHDDIKICKQFQLCPEICHLFSDQAAGRDTYFGSDGEKHYDSIEPEIGRAHV